MGNQVSPGLYVQELDFTQYSIALSSTTLAVLGGATKGPMNKPTLVTSQGSLIQQFGPPLLTDLAIQAALQYLQRGNKLLFTRVGNGYQTAQYNIPGLAGGTPAAKASGTITFTNNFNPADGWTVTISDGAVSKTFEFDNNAAVTGGNIAVTIGATAAISEANLIAAINNAAYNVVAVDSTVTVPKITVTNKVGGTAGNVTITTTGSAALTTPGAPTLTPSTTGGTLATGTYGYRVSALNAFGETLAGTEATSAVTGPTGSVGLSWSAVTGATSYNIYGRTAGGELKIGQTSGTTFTDTGAATPAGALPGGNTTAALLGVSGMAGGTNAIAGSNTNVLNVQAASPGSWGNTLQVTITTPSVVVGAPSQNFDLAVSAPSQAGSSTNVQVERYTNLSLTAGDSRFVDTVLAKGLPDEQPASKYLTSTTLAAGTPTAGTYTLGSAGGATTGLDGISGLTAADYIGTISGQTATGLQAVRNAETTEYNLIAIPGVTNASVISALIAHCEFRRDCFALIDVPFGLSSDNAVAWVNGQQPAGVPNSPATALVSSYAAAFAPWLKQYDPYNKQYVWMPPSGFVAAIMASSDRLGGPWLPPAGPQRGSVSAYDIEYSPNQDQRDTMVGDNNVNPFVALPGSGITLYGNKTLQRNASATQSIHARRTLIYAEKLIATAGRYLVMEPNDPTTWQKLENLVNQPLSQIAANNGIQKFQVVCNANTNPPEQRARKIISGSIVLQPTDIAEKVVLNFAATSTGAAFGDQGASNLPPAQNLVQTTQV